MWIFAFGRSSSQTLILTKLFDNKEDSQIHIHLLKKNTHHLYLALLYALLHLSFNLHTLQLLAETTPLTRLCSSSSITLIVRRFVNEVNAAEVDTLDLLAFCSSITARSNSLASNFSNKVSSFYALPLAFGTTREKGLSCETIGFPEIDGTSIDGDWLIFAVYSSNIPLGSLWRLFSSSK